MLQVLPLAQAVQLPPQSTPLSVPFCALSEHVAAWHAPPEQTRLSQSAAAQQAVAVPQRAQLEPPPQSTALSPPF
jgi:hypothetical protein